MKLLAFGEVLWDIYPESEHIGGAPLNFAAHFRKCGGKSWIITAVGKDALGDKTIAEIEKMGVYTSFIARSDAETGKCLVTLDEKQIPSYNLLNNVAYDFIKIPNLNGEKFDVLYFGTLAIRNENNRNTIIELIKHTAFENIFVDINIRPPYFSENVINLALENATIIKISDEELPVVMDFVDKNITSVKDCAKKIASDYENLKMVIITRGEKGAYVYDCRDGKSYECDAQKVKLVSTVGAGDSFSASFMAEYMKTNDISSTLDLATKVSEYVVSKKEAIPDYDVNNFKEI